MYQQDTETLVQDAALASVVFAEAFDTPPEFILPVVQNTSADDPKIVVQAFLIDKDENGFQVALVPPPPTGNYELSWTAGDTQAVLETVSAEGVPALNLPTFSSEPPDSARMLLVTPGVTPSTKGLSWTVLKSLLWRRVSSPASPQASGAAGQIALGTNGIYVHNGTLWGYIPFNILEHSDGSAQARRGGSESIAQDATSVSVSYATPLPSLPRIQVSVENRGAGADQDIPCLITANTVNGFTVELGEAPSSTGYLLHWEARI